MGGKAKRTGNLLPKTFLRWAKEDSLVDAWRTRYPRTSDFTYYSHRHQTWSRIDMCWISASLMGEIEEIKILPGSFTDHKPILATIKDTPKARLWRFDTIYLRNKKFVAEVGKELKEFFERNIQEETSIITTWEASNVYLRGLAIRQAIR